MTQNNELSGDIVLDDELLLELEQFISQDSTIMEDDQERKQKLEDDIFVAKLAFAEQVTKKIVKLTDELGLDELLFAKPNQLDSLIDEEYRFALNSEITLFCLTESGLYRQLNLLGGTEEFFPHDVSVDANSNQVIVRMRPMFNTIGKYFDFGLPFADDETKIKGKPHPVDREVTNFISGLFSIEFNQLSRSIRHSLDEYNREVEYLTIKKNYQDKGVEAW